MARYQWPREFRKSQDALEGRTEQGLRLQGLGIPMGLLGDLQDIVDIVSAHFQNQRLWLPLGPSIMTNGQAAGNPVVAGRVRDIRIGPDGQRVYVGSANGGVWYSADAGATWAPVGSWGLASGTARDDISLTIGALDVRFGQNGDGTDNPDLDVVYVGTGEIKPRLSNTPGGKQGGIGVLRLNGTITDALASPGANPWQREANNLAGAGIFRLAHDPAAALSFDPAGANTLVAATSNGLWARSGAFAEDADWQRVSFAPSDFDANDGPYCTDVVWNDRGLWVTLVGSGSDDGVYRSTNGIAGPFAAVSIPNLDTRERLSLAPAPHDTRRMYILGKRPRPAVDDNENLEGHAHLWQVDLTHTPNAPTIDAFEVANFPVGLFSSSVKVSGGNFFISRDQSHYDHAIAVTQQGANDVVFVGGSTQDNVGWEASLFRLTVTGTAAAGDLSTDFAAANQATPAADPTYAGRGVHADLHVLRLHGTELWVGCDGGVFLRDNAGNARSLNAGLATCEPGYIQSHPTLDGLMLAGTQDNGFIQRVGDTVWRLRSKGDGGGNAYHPTKPQQLFRQYVRASWDFYPGMNPRGPALRNANNALMNTESTENGRAEFYSQPAVATTNNANQARVFAGTDRIWYSADWDAPGTAMNWVTIPTNSDPYNATNAQNDIEQDRLSLDGRPDPVVAMDFLSEGDTANGFDGTALLVLCARTVRVFRYAQATNRWTAIADSIVSDQPGGGRPKQKKVDGAEPDPFLDYLPLKSRTAWTDIAAHDGARGTFYVTTSGRAEVKDDGTLEEDATFDTLWWCNGAGRWYPTGLRNAPADATAGTVGSKASAHSVLVHPDSPETVYVGNRIGVWEGRIDESGTHPSWTWRPILEGLPQALVEDLSIFKAGDKVFLRAALVARGVWERDISASPASVGRTFIRALPYDTGRVELPAAPLDPVFNNALNYHSSPDLVLVRNGHPPPWDPRLPNEAELMDAPWVFTFARDTHDAFVMVHHRHTTPVPGADVSIHLFLQRGAPVGSVSGIALTDQWRQAIIGTVNGGAPAFPANLSPVGVFHPAQPVDARTPRAVRIPVDLSFPIVGPGPSDYVALIAVVTSPGNALPATDLDHPNLEDVVRRSAQIAVRKVRRS